MDLAPTTHQHVYRQSARTRLFFLLVGCFYAAIGILIFLLTLPSANTQLEAWLMPGIGLAAIILGVVQARTYWRRVLILSDTKVGTEFTFLYRELHRSDIAAKRTRRSRQGSQTILIPHSSALPSIVIHSGFVVDEFYEAWIASIPDLDPKRP